MVCSCTRMWAPGLLSGLVHSRNPIVQRCPVHCRCSINVQGMMNEWMLPGRTGAHESFHSLAVWAPCSPFVYVGHLAHTIHMRALWFWRFLCRPQCFRLSCLLPAPGLSGVNGSCPAGCKELTRCLDPRLVSFLEFLQSFPSIVFGCSFLS